MDFYQVAVGQKALGSAQTSQSSCFMLADADADAGVFADADISAGVLADSHADANAYVLADARDTSTIRSESPRASTDSSKFLVYSVAGWGLPSACTTTIAILQYLLPRCRTMTMITLT